MTTALALQLVSGLVSASILFLVASGVSLIFGVCRVLNLAHGAFFLFAAFLAYSITSAVGASPLAFWLSLLIAPLVVGLIGAALEIVLFRRFYQADILVQVLPTMALLFLFTDLTRFLWGVHPVSVPLMGQFGSVELLGLRFPGYYGLVVFAGVAIALGLWFLIYRTRWGMLVRATAQDREMSAALGIDERRLYTQVFGLALWLAGVAGVLSVPVAGAALGRETQATIDAFVVVVIGGLGSIGGSMLGALLIGLIQAYGIMIIPQFAIVFVFGLMALVLILRPTGLVGRG